MRIVQSNRGDVLAREIGALLQTPLTDPFAAELIVVSGRPAELYLRARLAQEIGIAANIRMLSASTLLTETIGVVLGDVDGATAEAWRCQRLTWSIVKILPSLLNDPAFEPVRFYLAGAGSGSGRTIGLARRIAECFERYQTARPELIEEWEKGGGVASDWQPLLWRRLQVEIGSPSMSDLTARAIARLQSKGTQPIAGLPARLTWLGHSNAAPLHLRWLAALSDCGVDVNFFVLTLSKTFAVASGKALPGGDPVNPLAQSLGQEGAAFAKLLEQTLSENASIVDESREQDGEQMLAALQNDVLRDRRRGSGDAQPLSVRPDDTSLQVHACHGQLRQVEVLRDELLRVLDQTPDLQPRDITVLTPSIAGFAPLIDAVFAGDGGHGPARTPAIPFRIVDRPRRSGNAAADALLRVLSMVTGRVDAAEVLDLLALEPVASRFGLTGDERSTLVAWVRDSGVRWGIDAEHRHQFGLPKVEENSWRFGLDRLLVGYAIPAEGRVLFEGVLPYDEIEGGAADLLGRFADACGVVFRAVRSLAEPRSVSQWRTDIFALIDDLLDDRDAELAWPIRNVRESLNEMAQDAIESAHDEPLDLAGLKLLLDERFSEPAIGGGYGAGGVTFGSLRPGRTVPTRVMVLLGMDAVDFPRRRGGSGFDLVVREPQPGDSDPAMADRQRFLEALMGARERLLIMYTGRDPGTNEVIPPAVPIAELLDVIDASFVATGGDGGRKARDSVIREHPLQPFSPTNFTDSPDGNHGGNSYSTGWLEGATRLRSARAEEPPFLRAALTAGSFPASRVIAVDDLTQWIGAPARMLLQQRFGLSLGADAAGVETREPVQLDGLVSHQICTELLEMDFAGDAAADAYPLVRASGRLPHGTPGRMAYDAIAGEATSIAFLVRQLRAGARGDHIDIDLSVDGRRVIGREPGLYGGIQFAYQAGQPKAKQILDLWIRHLALQMTPGSGLTQSILVGKECSEGAVVRLSLAQNPVKCLATIVALFLEAQGEPAPFFPETSKAWAACMIQRAGAPDARAKAEQAGMKKWNPSFGPIQAYAEANDLYVQRAFGRWSPFGDDRNAGRFRELSLAVWTPLLECMTRAAE